MLPQVLCVLDIGWSDVPKIVLKQVRTEKGRYSCNNSRYPDNFVQRLQ